MQIITKEGEVQGVEVLDLTKWSTLCAENCPLKALYPYYHSPHYPFYPIYAAKSGEDVAE